MAVSSMAALLAWLLVLVLVRHSHAKDSLLSSHINERAREFRTLAESCGTDKATENGHTYQNAYARFIPGDPRILQSSELRIFEIGLG